MYIDFGNVKLHIGMAFAVFLAVAANTTEGRIYFLTVVFSFLHEAVHLLCLFYFGCRNAVINFSPGGIKISAEGMNALSYRNLALCAASAPLINIVLFGLFFSAGRITDSSLFYEISAINLIMGVSNLLPLAFLDGGRVVYSLICLVSSERKAAEVLDICSVISLLLIFCVFFVLFIKGYRYIFLIIFFIYCTVGYICDKTKGGIT